MWSPSFPQVTCSIGRIILRTSSFCTHQDLMDELCCIPATRIWRTTSVGGKQIVSVPRKQRFVQLSSLPLNKNALCANVFVYIVVSERTAGRVVVFNNITIVLGFVWLQKYWLKFGVFRLQQHLVHPESEFSTGNTRTTNRINKLIMLFRVGLAKVIFNEEMWILKFTAGSNWKCWIFHVRTEHWIYL